MRVYGNCGTMPHTGSRPTPTLAGVKHPPKATALGADLLKAPGHIDHIGKKHGPRAKVVPPKTCLQCGNEFSKPPNLSSYNWGNREFCSIACSNMSRVAKQKAVAAQKPPCHCGRPFYAKGLCSSHYDQQRKAARR